MDCQDNDPLIQPRHSPRTPGPRAGTQEPQIHQALASQAAPVEGCGSIQWFYQQLRPGSTDRWNESPLTSPHPLLPLLPRSH